MKIKVFRNGSGECEIEIDEKHVVNDLISFVNEKLQISSNDDLFLCLIYENCILENSELISYYQLKPNDKIWMGSIIDYIQDDDCIVDCFVNESKLIHCIMKKEDKILNILSLIQKFTSNFQSIYVLDINKTQLDSNQIVGSICGDHGYQRIIFQTDTNHEDDKRNFESYDRYLLEREWWKFHRRSWLYMFLEFPRMSEIIRSALEDVITENGDGRLNKNLSEMPKQFINSRLFFVTRVLSQIIDLVQSNLRESGESLDMYLLEHLVDYFSLTICVAVTEYIKSREYNDAVVNKSLTNILTDSLLYLVDSSDYDWIDLFHMFCNEFLLKPIDQCDIMDGLEYRSYQCDYIKLNMLDRSNSVSYPEYAQSMGEIKEHISQRVCEPKKLLYAIEKGSSNQLTDLDKLDKKKDNYLLEFLMNMDNIEILENIGSGSFGDVFLCRDKIHRMTLVLKQQRKQSLYKDINAYSCIGQSSQIIPYVGLYMDKNHVNLAMKFFSSVSLRTFLKERQFLRENEISKMCYQLLVQIKEFHELGIIHCDIKSDNIIINEHYQAKFIDFGSFTCSDSVHENIKGAIRYRAPEIFNNEPYSNKIDIWSFGATVVEMITGKTPYDKHTEIAAALKIKEFKLITFEPPYPLSSGLSEFIQCCLNANQNERSSAAQLLFSPFICDYPPICNK